MKMKLVICTTDDNYASRFVDYFNIHYADRVDLVQFTDETLLQEYTKSNAADVCLLGKEFYRQDNQPVKEAYIPVLLTEDRDEEAEIKTIFKYQKAEMIYKELLNVFADRKSGIKMFRRRNPNQARTYAFCSASGGCGATTVALAYAMNLAKEKSVLYLNLQQMSNADIVLQAEGNGRFDDVIFALKSKRTNLSLKLESLVRTSKEKVCFFLSSNNPLDMQEISAEEIRHLLQEIVSSDLYQEVVIDIDNSLRDLEIAVMEEVDHIVLVEGGNEENAIKFQKYYRALESIENRNEKEIVDKLLLFYNKFSNKNGHDITGGQVPVIGGMPRFEGVQMAGIVQRASIMDVFNQLKNLENSAS